MNPNASNVVVQLSDPELYSDPAGGYIIVETANFNFDKRDDVFYMVEYDNTWHYGASYQEPEIGEDSLFYYGNPAVPDMIEGTPMDLFHSYPCLEMGDFNGDGIEEAVNVWSENEIVYLHIITVTDVGGNLAVSPLAVFTDGEVSLEVANGKVALAVGTGDLNDDGTDEIFISSCEDSEMVDPEYFAFVKIYDVSADGNWTIEPKGRLVYDDEHLGTDPDIVDGELSHGRTTVEGIHPVPTADYSGPESIFAAVAVDHPNDFSSFEYLYVYRIDASEDLESLEIVGTPLALDNNGGSQLHFNSPFESHKGDLNGDSQDDVVLLASSYSIFTFEDGEIVLKDQGTGPPLDLDNGPLNESTDRFEIGDVNRDGFEDIVSQTKILVDDPFNGHKYFITVHSCDANLELFEAGDTDFLVESGQSMNGYGFAIGNLDGNDLCLGDPITMSCDYYKPIMILEAVPNHFDIVDDVEYDINSCYDIENPGSCENAVSFSNTVQTCESSSVEVSSDWAVSEEWSAAGEYEGFGINAALGERYGEQFSNLTESSTCQEVSITATANSDDYLHLWQYPFFIAEYPVLDPVGDTVLWIIAAFPDIDEGPTEEFFGSKELFNYIPNHEVGNILSYPKPDDPDLFYDKSDDDNWLIFDDFITIPLAPSGLIEYTLTQEASDALESSSTTSQTLSAEIGVTGLGLGYSQSGEYTESKTEVFGQTLSEAESYVISAVNIIGGTDVWNYKIKPTLYWTDERATKLAMSVDLSDAGQNWVDIYGQQPDPALNLPYRYEYAYSEFYIEDNLDRTKSIRFDKINPNPTDTLTAFVRVFNYSLLAMDQEVEFSLYNGDPDSGGEIIEDLDGNTVFTSGEILEDQGRSTVEVQFEVTNEMVGGLDNRVYIVLDPNEQIAEIHESNNKGWTNIGYTCNTPDGSVGIDEFVLIEEGIQFNVYPNPAMDNVTLDFDASLEFINRAMRLCLYSLDGNLISEHRFSSNRTGQFTFDVSNLPDGIYLYQVGTTDEVIHNGKLVVVR